MPRAVAPRSNNRKKLIFGALLVILLILASSFIIFFIRAHENLDIMEDDQFIGDLRFGGKVRLFI